MDSPDMLKVIHAAPLFAAKRRGNKARQRGAFEGLKTLRNPKHRQAVVEDYMESQDLSVDHLRAERSAKNECLGNLNAGIVQVPRARIDPRLRYIARLPEEGE
jgi:hypothetical protein